MPFPIEQKLVIGVASSALFDLSESHQVYLDEGPDECRLYQEQHLDAILGKGVAFPFIRRFLNINKCFPRQSPVEVVLFSRNSPETRLRVMRSTPTTASTSRAPPSWRVNRPTLTCPPSTPPCS
jgi:5'-nucleotidase